MQQLSDSCSISSLSDTEDAVSLNQDPAQADLLQDHCNQKDQHYTNRISSRASSISLKDLDDSPTGKSAYPSTISQTLLDLLLTLPAICFIIYAIIASYYDGNPVKTKAVSILQSVAPYGPTLFPIVFSAIATNFLKSVAAWKLERGITVLDLEFLLRSRTVFSSIALPISLHTITYFHMLVIALWVLSPLGGQAALRVVGIGFSTSDCSISYLDINSFSNSYLTWLNTSSLDSQSFIAFAAAIASPERIQTAKQDIFGHLKVPMIEPYIDSKEPMKNGWYQIDDEDGEATIAYASLAGLPAVPSGGFDKHSSYEFHLTTSYINTRCSLGNPIKKTKDWNWDEFVNFTKKGSTATTYRNDKTLLVQDFLSESSNQPRKLMFTSHDYITPDDYLTSHDHPWHEITNATCILTTSNVELQIACEKKMCNATSIRPAVALKDVARTVFDDSPSQAKYFFSVFVNSSASDWQAAPMQGYMMNPYSPFETPILATISNITNAAFSIRLSQLLNTFWMIRSAPSNALDNLQLTDPTTMFAPKYLETTGTRTVGLPLLKVNRVWFTLLIIASMAMLLSALAAAVLNILRRGPDILDHTIRLTRDTPYMGIPSGDSSVEHGIDFTRKFKHVRVCLGDVRPDEELGYIAIGTMENVVPLSRQTNDRMYE